MRPPHSLLCLLVLLLLAVGLPRRRATAGRRSSLAPVFRANTELVSVDVIVRDASGAVVRGLTAADFEVHRGRQAAAESAASRSRRSAIGPGAIAARLRCSATPSRELASESSQPASGAGRRVTRRAPKPMTSEELAGRRLIVLLFDISSMQPEDVQRAVDAATKYVNEKMAPADMVAVATISSKLDVLTDFTTDARRSPPRSRR